jgi:uncharacterized protein (DUF2267 family)
MDYTGFIHTVEEHAAIPRERAEQAVRATLQTLGERISGGEARDVAQQLPDELRPLLHDGDAQAFGVEEFLERVANREGVPVPTAHRHARAVFRALGHAVPPTELADVASELPKEYDELLDAARPPFPPAFAPPDIPPAEEIVDRIAELGGMSRERAWRATDAVLEALADRISGGEVDDLEVRLPSALHAPLERGRFGSGEARPLPLEEFVQGIADREGVLPDEALAHLRAVLGTLREVVGEKELWDVLSQLPYEFRMVLASP